MVRVPRALAHALVLCGLASGPATAASIDLSAGRDAVLYESATGDLANGAGTRQLAGSNGVGQVLRSLLDFDLDAVPDGVQVTSATLRLQIDTPQSRAGSLDVHRVTRAWSEGPSAAPRGEGDGASAQPGDVTWLHTDFDAEFWDAPGGDFDPTASAGVSFAGNGELLISSSGLAADVQAWLDAPGSAHGWLLRLADESGDAVRWQGLAGASPPLLSLQFTIVPEPSSAALLGLGLLALARRRGVGSRH